MTRRLHVKHVNSGQAVVVGVGIALILVIVLAVAASVWRELIVNRRTPEAPYRRNVSDIRQIQGDQSRHSDRLRARQSDPPDSGASAGW